MTGPETYRTKPRTVEALQFVLGESTKTDLLSFCPQANIGTLDGDDRDIRWFLLPTWDGPLEVANGDWIVQDENGDFDLLDADDFPELYEKTA